MAHVARPRNNPAGFFRVRESFSGVKARHAGKKFPTSKN